MNVRKRPRLELELNSGPASAAPPALLTTTAHTADLSEALLSGSTFGGVGGGGGQSLILTSAGNALLNSSAGAQIFLTICGDENSEDGDESQEYYAIKQEPGSDLDVHTLLPTNLQLPTGCEIYLVKDTSLASQPKASIKLEPELLSEKMVASRPVTLSVAATPAPVAAVGAASTAASPATSVLYGQTQRSVPEVSCAATAVNASVVPTTPASKLDAYKKRDDKRRATHNEVERRRRDKINSWIFKLKEMLPSLSSNGLSTGEVSPSPSTSTSTSTSCSAKSNLNPNPNPSPSGRTPPNDSKSQILIKACEYIKSMQGEIDTLRDCLREADGLRASNQALREELDRLKRQQQMQERFHTAASTRSTFNVTLNSLNSSATSDLFEGIDTTPNLAAVSSLGFGKRGLLISDYDE
ncbi:hypothetical protein KR038_000422 [Drosophila bunnanda]|nr:hypothetical protein KR038_000422 [Drosophila bunnanda]